MAVYFRVLHFECIFFLFREIFLVACVDNQKRDCLGPYIWRLDINQYSFSINSEIIAAHSRSKFVQPYNLQRKGPLHHLWIRKIYFTRVLESEDDNGYPKRPGTIASNATISARQAPVVRAEESERRDATAHEAKAWTCGLSLCLPLCTVLSETGPALDDQSGGQGWIALEYIQYVWWCQSSGSGSLVLHQAQPIDGI